MENEREVRATDMEVGLIYIFFASFQVWLRPTINFATVINWKLRVPLCSRKISGLTDLYLPVTLSRAGSAGSSSPLVCIGLTDGVHLQRIHADARVEHLNNTKQ